MTTSKFMTRYLGSLALKRKIAEERVRQEQALVKPKLVQTRLSVRNRSQANND